MKTQTLLTLAALATAALLPACTTVVEDPSPTVRSTTTTESTSVRPVQAVESTTVRTY